MKAIGIYLATSQLRYSVLAGTKAKPELIRKDRFVTTDPKNVAELMDWYESQFTSMLEKHAPDRIACCLTLTPNKQQLFTSCFPFGILYLLAHKRRVTIHHYVPQNYVASRLGLPQKTDLFVHCDQVFGARPPYWDRQQKYSVLAAWFELE